MPDFSSFNPLVADALVEATKRSPYASHLGIEVAKVEPGRIVCTMKVADIHHSGVGAVHGGAIVSLIDHSLSLAVYPLVEVGKWVATLEFKVSYVAPVKMGGATEIVAEAQVLSLKKVVAHVRVDVRANGELVATAQGTGYIRERLGAAT